MKSVAPETPFGYTIFCDDIREEKSGKTSYIGVYKRDLVIQGKVPAVVAKFGLSIHYFEGYGESSEPVEIRVFLPGDTPEKATLALPLAAEELNKIRQQAAPEGDNPRVEFLINGLISPLRIQGPGWIKVRAYRGDLEIKLGTLEVRVVPPAPETDKVETSKQAN